jgi:hypothetical protein
MAGECRCCGWVLLVRWAALWTGTLPGVLNYLGLVLGVTGILHTAVPALEVLGAVFGLGLIVWFVWLGIVLLRSNPSATAQQPPAFVPRHARL